MKQLEFFYDYACPFCMSGYKSLMKILEKYPDIEVIWRPCDVNPLPENNPYFNNFGIQGFYLAEESGANLVEYNNRLFQAINVDRINRSNVASYTNYLSGLLDSDALEEALSSGKYKSRQKEGNDYAYDEKGVWYLPALRMNDKALDASGGLGISERQIEKFLKKNR